MIFVAITRVTVHLVNTIAGSTRIKPTIINDFALSLSVFHHSHTKLDILTTSAIVKIILARVVSTSDVKTLRIDLGLISQS